MIQTILRLHFDEGIPLSGIRANQRLVNEDWLALGYTKFDIQHTVTPVEGVSQVGTEWPLTMTFCHTLQIHY